MRNSLAAGMRLGATYRKQEHIAEVVAGEDGKLRFRLADGREFASPSAAGSAVMGGISCNGWRFWSLGGELTEAPTKPAAATAGLAAPRKAKASRAAASATRKTASKRPKAATSVAAEVEPEREPWLDGQVS